MYYRSVRWLPVVLLTLVVFFLWQWSLGLGEGDNDAVFSTTLVRHASLRMPAPLLSESSASHGVTAVKEDMGPETTRPPLFADYCHQPSEVGKPTSAPVRFLYLPFRYDGTSIVDIWTSQMDHSYPTYKYGREGVVALLGEKVSYTNSGQSLSGGTLAFGPGKTATLFDSTNTPEMMFSKGFRYFYYRSPSLELYLGYDGHDGHDFADLKDWNLVPAAPGKVVFAGYHGDALGRVIEVYHEEGYLTRYAHLASVAVSVGQRVGYQDTLGVIGGSTVFKNTEGKNELVDFPDKRAYGRHLHLTVFRWDDDVRTWKITDPFGWDPWQSEVAQRQDPLRACNGEVSYNLWVGGAPRSYSQGNTAQTLDSPVADRYMGGFLDDSWPNGQVDAASFVGDVSQAADGLALVPGATHTKTWRVKNTGTTTWDGYRLVFVGGHQMGATSPVVIPLTLPNQEQNISITIQVPTVSSRSEWQIVDRAGIWVPGGRLQVQVTVPGSGPEPPRDGVEAVSLVSLEFPSVVAPGQTFRPRATFRVNFGQLLESRGDMLRNTDGNLYDAWPHVAVVGTIDAGQTYPFEFYADNPMRAPQAEGTYTSRWRVWRNGAYAGPEITIRFDVRAGGGTRPNPPVPQSPGDWYVSRDGSTPALCVNPVGGVQYHFQVFESHDTPDSGWIATNCWTPPALGPYTYQWHAQVRTGSLESDWGETRHFSMDSQQLTIDDLVFSHGSPSAAEEV